MGSSFRSLSRTEQYYHFFKFSISTSHQRQRMRNFSTSIVQSHNKSDPELSTRIQLTDEPCIVKTKRLVAGSQGTLSLAQGIVHWSPPPQATQAALTMANNPQVNQYGPDEGLPALRDALRVKVTKENGLHGSEVMVTAGANQAFTNVVLTLLDAGDECILFMPFYFNHAMALSMTGVQLLKGQCDSQTWHPDLDWLENTLLSPASSSSPKMVVICNPCNPTGVALSKQEVERAADICKKAGVWLVLDNTYEHFLYSPHQHYCLAAPHIINIFSFSKAYGMMGWRVGYLAFTDQEFRHTTGTGTTTLGGELLKVQDTIPICPPQLSQYVALGALEAGRGWVEEQVNGLEGNRQALLDALSPLGSENIAGGEGAIYLWAKLPTGCNDDVAVVEWLVNKHKVCLIPGSSCGVGGYIRAAFANLTPELCREAAQRLKRGLVELVQHGMT